MCPKPKERVPKGFMKLVRKEMQRKNMSLRQLADEVGIEPASLSRTLAGLQGIPRTDIILKIAITLEIDPPELLLYEANRIPADELQKTLLRTTSELTRIELREVLKHAKRLARERRLRKTKRK